MSLEFSRIHIEKFSLALCEFVESGAQAFEPGAKPSSIAADADPEMSWHLKEFSRDNGGLIFFAKQFEEGLRVTAS